MSPSVRIAIALAAVLLPGAVLWLRQRPDSDPPPAALADSDSYAGREAARRKTLQILFVCMYAALLVGVMLLPLSVPWKRLLLRSEVLLVVLYLWGLRHIKMRVCRIGFRGDYDRALRMDRFWSAVPFYGSSLRGMILFNAGRYREAQAFLKPLAFDAYGRPRLRSLELYNYALALENDNRAAEAQPLLEAAVSAAPDNDLRKAALRVALATCLLEQEKDPQRAARLLEEAMASPRRTGPSADSRADDARRIARYAWALAACGRRQEAQIRIDQAQQLAASLRSEDAAGVQYFVGEAWRVTGESAKAQAAYNEAVRLQPTGVIALSVKKSLEKMEHPSYA